MTLKRLTLLRANHAFIPAKDIIWESDWGSRSAIDGGFAVGARAVWECSILFSFETDFTGRVKAGPQIETWPRRSAAAFTPAVILFIALSEADDKTDPG